MDHDQNFLDLADRMERAFVWTLAPGGYNPAHAYGDDLRRCAYEAKKDAAGWEVFENLGVDGQAARMAVACVECDCVEWYENGNGKPAWEADRKCAMCRGTGRRTATTREREALEYRIRKQAEQEARDRCGEGCCVEYVMSSQDTLEAFGCWNPPRLTDGYTLDNSRRNRKPDKIVRTTFPVKIIKGTRIVAVVEKEVDLPVLQSRAKKRWIPVRVALRQRAAELTREIDEVAMTDAALAMWQGRLDACQRLISKINTIGDCSHEGSAVRDILAPDVYAAVAAPLF